MNDATHRQPEALLGRDDELEVLTASFDRVARDGSATVVVSGEAGIGKSTLVDLLVRARGDGVRVARGACSLHDLHPLACLEPLMEIADRSAVALLGGFGSSHGDGNAITGSIDELDARRAQALRGAVHAVLDAAGGEPLLLVLDDLHWASAPVLDFVHVLVNELARAEPRRRILLVLVTRVLPPPHQLAELLASIERRPRTHRLDLGALDESAIDRIAHELTDVQPTGTYLDLVRRSARGSPLRARAAVRVLDQRGLSPAASAGDRRTWGTLRFPLALDDPVTEWLHGLPAHQRAVLGAVATLGIECTVPTLTTIGEIGIGEAEACVGTAVELGILDHDGIHLWFAHSLFREVLYDALGPLERQRAHLRCAHHLAGAHATGATGATGAAGATGANRANVDVAIGQHLLAAGELAPAAERFDAYVRGARELLRLTMWADAARYLEAAASLQDSAAPCADLDALLGRAYYFDHDFPPAALHLRRAIESAAALTDEAAWADSLVMLIRLTTATNPEAWRRPTDDAPVRQFLRIAIDPARRSRVLEVLAEAQITAGRLDDAEETAEAAVALARQSGDASVIASATYAQAFNDMAAMRVGRSLDRTLDAARHAERGGDWFVSGIMKARLPFPLLGAGRLDEADAAAIASIADAVANHEYSNQALGHCVRAQAALLRGDFAATELLCAAADLATRRSGYVMADLFLAPTLVLCHLYQANFDAARAIARNWPNLPGSARRSLHALADAHEGVPSDAPTSVVRRPGLVNQVTVGFYVASLEAALLRGDLDVLASADEDLERWCADGLEFAPSCPVSLTRLRGEIRAALGDETSAADLLVHAAAMCARSGAPVEQARAFAALARLEAVNDRASRHAADLAQQAADIADRIGTTLRLFRPDLHADADPATKGFSTDWRVVMITDVVGSTMVSQELGDIAYLDLVLRHHEIVREVLHHRAGKEFAESGDGLLAWFADVGQALHAAVEIQQAMGRAASIVPRLEVKVGLAAGFPLFHGGRPYGLVVNRAARVLASASPGEIVIDEDVHAALPAAFGVGTQRALDLRGIGPHAVSTVTARQNISVLAEEVVSG